MQEYNDSVTRSIIAKNSLLASSLVILLSLSLVVYIVSGIIHSILTDAIPFFHAKHEVQRLEVVDDPVEFTKQFQTDGQTPIYFRIGSGFLGLGGRYIYSHLYPYVKLSTDKVDNDECMKPWLRAPGTRREDYFNRYIDSDPHWRVFWVEVGRCGEEGKFYGPYKLSPASTYSIPGFE